MMTKTYQMMPVLTNKTPFWLSGIALCLFLSCGQNVISVDPEPTVTVQQGNIELPEDLDTPLHRAILEQADLDYIKILLQTIDVNQPGNQAETALHLAARRGNLELLNILLAQQADVHAKSIQGWTPLHVAALAEQPEAIQVLLTKQAAIETKDNQGCTPLHLAALCGHPGAIQILLANKAAIETKDKRGWTPLHLAALMEHPESIQVLLDHQASIGAKDNLSRTPLHLAALKGQVAAAQLLINHQASIDVIDYKGRTPYDLVGSEAVKQLLGCHMNLSKLIFQFGYDNIGTRILNYLTTKEKGELRQTCTIMGWNLLQKGALHLQVTPDTLQHLHPYLHPRLYPHGPTPHCVCPTFEPIPVEVVVEEKKHIKDWDTIAQDKRFLIKNALYKGNIYQWDDVRADLPEHLRDSLTPSEEVRKYLEIQSTQKPVHSGNEKEYSDNEQVDADNEKEYSDNEQVNVDNEKEYSDNEQVDADNEKEYSDNEQVDADNEKTPTVDPENQLYNSFVGVKKLPTGKVTIGNYIATGTFGKVYRGQWGDKPVALKQINLDHAYKNLYGNTYKRLYKGTYIDIPIGYEAIKEGMQWEVARLSTVNHPNLVQFHGLYQDGNEDYTYLVMDFCEGGTLQGALGKKHIPWPQRWQWTVQISQALSYMHQEGVLHRDLKAENILLDANGRAKLADLGVAQVDALLQAQEAKIVKAGLQDRRFIAPELELDPTLSTQATDIYALGLVFWQIASGKEPRRIDDLSSEEKEDWRRGREREPIPADCPESFKQLMLECWAKDPNQRPTAKGVLAKLAALGPELDPYHYQLVTAAQRLEQLVHPKRKEGRAYIAPFVTQYSVDESIETYWSRVEAAKAKDAQAEGREPALNLSKNV